METHPSRNWKRNSSETKFVDTFSSALCSVLKKGCVHRYRKAKIDCLRFVMCPLLAQLEIGFFSSFSAAAVYSTNEANKAGLKQSIIFRCLWLHGRAICTFKFHPRHWINNDIEL